MHFQSALLHEICSRKHCNKKTLEERKILNTFFLSVFLFLFFSFMSSNQGNFFDNDRSSISTSNLI